MGKNIDGEKQIEKILKELNLQYDRKKKIFLSKDAKNFRVPDFYLEKYNLIIEYFGSWNNKKNKAMEKRERARFMEKAGAYEESGINCLYIYPGDLIRAKELIQKKIAEINGKRKAKEIAESISVKRNTEVKLLPKPVTTKTTTTTTFTEHKVLVKPHTNHRKENESFDYDLLGRIILVLDGIIVLLFLALGAISGTLFAQGNPLSSELHGMFDLLYGLFIIIVPISIILSAVFAYKKRLAHGFIYVSIILIVFYIALLLIFNDPLQRIIIILISTIAIVPSEYFMITSNK